MVISSISLHLAPIHLLLQHLTQLQMELLQHSFRIKIVTTLTLPVYFSHGEHAFQAQTEHISIQQPKLEASRTLQTAAAMQLTPVFFQSP